MNIIAAINNGGYFFITKGSLILPSLHNKSTLPQILKNLNDQNGPIIVIEDDLDDQDILTEIFKDLNYKNEIVFFTDGNTALEFLDKEDTSPFLILSDINMPKINGFELRNKIHVNEKLHLKCIPYLFFTTGANKKTVIDAYALSVQGFFKKPHSVTALKETIRKIVEYWQECIAPSEFE